MGGSKQHRLQSEFQLLQKIAIFLRIPKSGTHIGGLELLGEDHSIWRHFPDKIFGAYWELREVRQSSAWSLWPAITVTSLARHRHYLVGIFCIFGTTDIQPFVAYSTPRRQLFQPYNNFAP